MGPDGRVRQPAMKATERTPREKVEEWRRAITSLHFFDFFLIKARGAQARFYYQSPRAGYILSSWA